LGHCEVVIAEDSFSVAVILQGRPFVFPIEIDLGGVGDVRVNFSFVENGVRKRWV